MKSINEKNDEVMFKECSWNTFLNMVIPGKTQRDEVT